MGGVWKPRELFRIVFHDIWSVFVRRVCGRGHGSHGCVVGELWWWEAKVGVSPCIRGSDCKSADQGREINVALAGAIIVTARCVFQQNGRCLVSVRVANRSTTTNGGMEVLAATIRKSEWPCTPTTWKNHTKVTPFRGNFMNWYCC